MTINHLTQAGYKNWDGLVLNQPDNSPSVKEYKTEARAKIDARHRIIANVGDQYTDLLGGYAERTFRVLNPFYFIP